LPKARRQRPLIGLNLRYVGDPEIDNEKTLAEAANLAERLIADFGAQVFFLSISQHPSKRLEDDKDFGNQVAKRLGGTEDFKVLNQYYRPEEMMALLGEFDCLILSRLHATILAWKMGVPFYAISYDHKVTEFVKLIGLQKRLLMLKDFTASKTIEQLSISNLIPKASESSRD